MKTLIAAGLAALALAATMGATTAASANSITAQPAVYQAGEGRPELVKTDYHPHHRHHRRHRHGRRHHRGHRHVAWRGAYAGEHRPT